MTGATRRRWPGYELRTSRGTAPLSLSALPRPESEGFVVK